MDTTLVFLPVALTLWLDQTTCPSQKQIDAACLLMQFSRCEWHANMLKQWNPDVLEQRRYKTRLLTAWYSLPNSHWPWIDGMDRCWAFSLGGYTRTRDEIVHTYLDCARSYCYSIGLQVGSPDWIEYRIATYWFASDLLQAGFSKEFVAGLLKYLQEREDEWKAKHQYLKTPVPDEHHELPEVH